MTKLEKNKAEKLIDKALRNYKNSQDDWELYEKFKNENNSVEAEIHLRKFQNSISYAEGIYQALAVLGFDHPKMKEFSKLL